MDERKPAHGGKDEAPKPATYSLAEGDVVVTLPPKPLSPTSVDELQGHLTLFLTRAKKDAEAAAAKAKEEEAAEQAAAKAKADADAAAAKTKHA